MTSYGYDPVSGLQSLGHDLLSAGSDFSATLTRNAAGQIVTRTATDGAYAFAATAQSRTDTHNGLNQIASLGGSTAIGHDANGNVSLIGTNGYSYAANNRLATVWNGVTYLELIDDSMDRLHRYYDGAANRWLLHDGETIIAESNPNAGTIARRYVHGPGTDEPLVWYEGGTRRWLHADERGSIVAVSDAAGQALAYHAYDEYGRPQGPSGLDSLYGRFGYTGQPWLPELRLYYYRARMYDPVVTVRFMQTDSAGYEAGENLYWYANGDSINATDPDGRQWQVIIPIARGLVAGARACAANATCSSIAGTGIRIVLPGLRPISPPPLRSDNTEGDSEGIRLRPDETGKVHGTLPDADEIAPDDLEESANALDASIQAREQAIRDHPVGNPNGSAREQREHRQHEQHQERVRRERDLRDRIRGRME